MDRPQGDLSLRVGAGLFDRTRLVTTLAGRFGVTYDRLMLYVKGGIAWSKVTYSASLSLGSPFDFTTSVSDTRVGAMFGTGIEYAFLGNWSAKIEYNFIDFRDQDYTFPLAFAAGPFNVNLNTQHHHQGEDPLGEGRAQLPVRLGG